MNLEQLVEIQEALNSQLSNIVDKIEDLNNRILSDETTDEVCSKSEPSIEFGLLFDLENKQSITQYSIDKLSMNIEKLSQKIFTPRELHTHSKYQTV